MRHQRHRILFHTTTAMGTRLCPTIAGLHNRFLIIATVVGIRLTANVVGVRALFLSLNVVGTRLNRNVVGVHYTLHTTKVVGTRITTRDGTQDPFFTAKVVGPRRTTMVVGLQ